MQWEVLILSFNNLRNLGFIKTPHYTSTTVGGAVYIAVYVKASIDLWGGGVLSLFLET